MNIPHAWQAGARPAAVVCYRKVIRSHPPLSRGEERALAIRARNGEMIAKHRLIYHNLALVSRIAALEVETMKIRIEERDGVLTETQRSRAERRLGLALGRFGDRIGRVTLRFATGVGRSGSTCSRCRIDVGLQPKRLSVEEADAGPLAALERAADRVSRMVARTLEREHELDGSRVRAQSTSKGLGSAT